MMGVVKCLYSMKMLMFFALVWLALIPFVDIFCNIDKIHHISAPIMIVHGTRDVSVRHSHGVVSEFSL